MESNKLNTVTNLFEGNEIRSIWNKSEEDYYFSVIDVIVALNDSSYEKARNYWKWLKTKLKEEGSELVSNTNQLKMKAKDGKLRSTDTLNTEGIFRLIQSIPSPKAEPFKLWLAKLGRKEVDSVFDPSIGIDKMIDYYLKKGYDISWIEKRMKAIIDRKKLTKVWQDNGIKEKMEYAILTNEIYKEWSGMTAGDYKEFKGIRKESLRDNMNDIEIILTDLGELATRELTKTHNPYGLDENKRIAKLGGSISKRTKEDLENKLGHKVISKENNINKKYRKEC